MKRSEAYQSLNSTIVCNIQWILKLNSGVIVRKSVSHAWSFHQMRKIIRTSPSICFWVGCTLVIVSHSSPHARRFAWRWQRCGPCNVWRFWTTSRDLRTHFVWTNRKLHKNQKSWRMFNFEPHQVPPHCVCVLVFHFVFRTYWTCCRSLAITSICYHVTQCVVRFGSAKLRTAPNVLQVGSLVELFFIFAIFKGKRKAHDLFFRLSGTPSWKFKHLQKQYMIIFCSTALDAPDILSCIAGVCTAKRPSNLQLSLCKVLSLQESERLSCPINSLS